MKSQEIIAKYKNLRFAEISDNKSILEFYNSLSMEGGSFKVSFVKDPDYFKFLEYEAELYKVYLFEDDDKNIEGMFSVTIRPCYVNGKVAHVGHFSDLRFKRKKDRKTTTSWKEVAGAFVDKGREIEDFKKCDYYLGSYLESNIFAKKAIGTEKKVHKNTAPPKETSNAAKEAEEKPAFKVSNISRYEMVSILARKPLKMLGQKFPSKSGLKINVTQAKEKEIGELKDFLEKQNINRTLGYIYKGENAELERRFRVWDDFNISNFYLARDNSGKLLGCFAAWNPTSARRIMVDKFPGMMAFLSKVVKLFGKKVPREGAELETLYITNLEIDHSLPKNDRQYILHSLLDNLYKEGIVQKYHILGLCDYLIEGLSEGMEKYYVVERTGTTLYQLFTPSTGNVIKEKELNIPPGHEMVMT